MDTAVPSWSLLLGWRRHVRRAFYRPVALCTGYARHVPPPARHAAPQWESRTVDRVSTRPATGDHCHPRCLPCQRCVWSRFMGRVGGGSTRVLHVPLGSDETCASDVTFAASKQVAYRDVAAAESGATPEVRKPPEWAQQLLNTVARQCALRKRDSEQVSAWSCFP